MVTAAAEWLLRAGAHHDVVGWAERYGDDWALAWAECPRGDWLLSIAVRAGLEPAAVARAALAVARFGLEDEPIASCAEALEVAERALTGAAPVEALEPAAAALEAEAAAIPEPHAAVTRQAVACAVRALAQPEDAAFVPSLLAQAAAMGAGDCAMMEAARYTLRRSAEIVRDELSALDVPALLAARCVAEPGDGP